MNVESYVHTFSILIIEPTHNNMGCNRISVCEIYCVQLELRGGYDIEQGWANFPTKEILSKYVMSHQIQNESCLIHSTSKPGSKVNLRELAKISSRTTGRSRATVCRPLLQSIDELRETKLMKILQWHKILRVNNGGLTLCCGQIGLNKRQMIVQV